MTEPTILRCEGCGRGVHPDEAVYDEPTDENICPRCKDNRDTNRAEAYQERLNEDFHDGGGQAWPDAERKRMEEARKLK